MTKFIVIFKVTEHRKKCLTLRLNERASVTVLKIKIFFNLAIPKKRNAEHSGGIFHTKKRNVPILTIGFLRYTVALY